MVPYTISTPNIHQYSLFCLKTSHFVVTLIKYFVIYMPVFARFSYCPFGVVRGTL